MSRVLANKDSNVISPVKSKSSSTSPIRNPSPVKRARHITPVKVRHVKSSSLSGLSSASVSPVKGFKIYEDPVISGMNGLTVTNEINDIGLQGQENYEASLLPSKNQQENILQPKYKILKQHGFRKPLGNLPISEYCGFIETGSKPIKLQEPFVPKSYKNESNSIHKFFHNYPSYVTPVKSNQRFLFKSVESNEFNEDDALEQDLFKKSLLIKRKRSLSLGKNDLKLHLIKKNGFTILSN